MLVKMGYMGKEVKEYFIGNEDESEDDFTLLGLLDIVGIDADEDSCIHISYGQSNIHNEVVHCEQYYDVVLDDGATYIYEVVEFTSVEKLIIDVIAQYNDDMPISEKKKIIQKIMVLTDNNWDKE